MYKLIFVLTVYNEESVICDFLTELNVAFHDLSHKFIVVNDKSTDQTVSALSEISQTIPLEIITNESNLGHGRSLLRGLNQAINQSPSLILTVDGDGHFIGSDIRRLFDMVDTSNSALLIIEGCRENRLEPKYRKITSLITRVMVWMRCRQLPRDANTPLRIYTNDALVQLLLFVPRDSVIPNLHFSSITRRLKIPREEISIAWFNRKGIMQLGTTWGISKSNLLPTKRFIKFCLVAFSEWFQFRV